MNPQFPVPLNENKLNQEDVKEMPAWFKTPLDYINKIAETLFYAQEVNILDIFIKLNQTLTALLDWLKGSGGGDAVTSVNTKTGAVTLDTDDIPEGTTNKYLTEDPILNSIKAASSSGLSIKSSTDTEIFKIEDTGQLKAVYESTVGTDYNTTLHNIYGARAWVNFNGSGTVAIRASGNVSSITDNGTGDFTVNFTTNMPDIGYVAIGSASNEFIQLNSTQTVGGYRLTTKNQYQSLVDDVNIRTAVFR